ncbi:MAG: type II toxin-antitoxin system VapC family toxin [Candidatus Dormibacteraceae bacterium]
MRTYFDTSALIKLVLDEPGSMIAQAAWNLSDATVSSTLAFPEACAAIGSAQRAGRLSRVQVWETIGAVEERCADMDLLRLDDGVLWSAAMLAVVHRLRGDDAVHLASAASLGDPDLLFATWDQDLAGAAQAMGYSVVP